MSKLNTPIESFSPTSREDWRLWLEANHASTQAIWLIYYKRKSTTQTISYSEALDDALCYGWIDSTLKSIDDDRFIQFFSKRKPTSVWSKVNKAKIEQLIAAGLMRPAGYESIECAKQNGYWSILDEVEDLVIPQDLELAFDAHPGSKTFFMGLSKSIKKGILQWLILAKREDTRQKRLTEIATLAAEGRKPKQF